MKPKIINKQYKWNWKAEETEIQYLRKQLKKSVFKKKKFLFQKKSSSFHSNCINTNV